MSLIFFVQSLFGNLFVLRTLHLFRARALLSTSTVTETGIAFVCANIWIHFFGARYPGYASLLLLLAILLTAIALYLFEARQIAILKLEVPLFLDRWILNLRLGSALPTARDVALRDHSESFQTLLRPLFVAQNTLSIKRAHLLFSAPVLAELERLQQEPHTALGRLENLRELLRKVAEFRRKSGQAVRQTHIQSSVMLFLLFALVFFTLHRYGWKRISDLVAMAVFLSFAGVIIMYFMSRKTKWKI